jgi:transposase-like protein
MKTNSGHCPQCKSTVTSVNIEHVAANGKIAFTGVSYVCPSCNCVLGVELDPIAAQADLLEDLKKLLRRG